MLSNGLLAVTPWHDDMPYEPKGWYFSQQK